MSTGEWWSAEKSRTLGLVDGVMPLGDLLATFSKSPQTFVSARQEVTAMKTVQSSSAPAETGAPSGGAPNVGPLSAVQSAATGDSPPPAAQVPAAGGGQSGQPAPANPAAPEGQQSTQAPASPVAPAVPETTVASPVAGGQSASQAPADVEQPATYQEIIAACQGHAPTSDFIVAQQAAGATPSQVAKNFVNQLVESRAVQTAGTTGTEGLTLDGSAEPGGGQQSGDIMEQVEIAINAAVQEGGLDRSSAARQVFTENSGWLEAYQKANQEMKKPQKLARRQRNCGAFLGSFQQAGGD